MNSQQQAHFDQLYKSHLNHLTLQGKRPATIDTYARAVRRITVFFDCPPDTLEAINKHPQLTLPNSLPTPYGTIT